MRPEHGDEETSSRSHCCDVPLDFSIATDRSFTKYESSASDQSNDRLKRERRRFPSSSACSTRGVLSDPNEPDAAGNAQDIIYHVTVRGEPLVCLEIVGVQRLCLAQISSTLLKNFSYNEIHNRRVALGITCVQCSPAQLELLREAGAMPASSRRCGTITRREAERLVKSFLDEPEHPKLPEGFAFDVVHHCGWGCKGQFVPSRYNSSRAKCVRCNICQVYFSPNKFVFHSHSPQSTGLPSNPEYRHPDAANFNAWRRHLFLAHRNPSVDLVYAWEDVKAMFNGGNRKRTGNSSMRSASQSSSDERPNSGCASVYEEFGMPMFKRFSPAQENGACGCVANLALAIDTNLYPDESIKRKRPMNNIGTVREKDRITTNPKHSPLPVDHEISQLAGGISPGGKQKYDRSDNELKNPTNTSPHCVASPIVNQWHSPMASISSLGTSKPGVLWPSTSRGPFSSKFDNPVASGGFHPDGEYKTTSNRIPGIADDYVMTLDKQQNWPLPPIPLSMANIPTTPPSLIDSPSSQSTPMIHPWSLLFAHKFWDSACASISITSPQLLAYLDGLRARLCGAGNVYPTDGVFDVHSTKQSNLRPNPM